MRGPVTTSNTAPVGPGSDATETTFEIIDSANTLIGGVDVRRALPRRGRRTVGPWCLADQFGPTSPDQRADLNVAPRPHIGLQTVTWLFTGELWTETASAPSS
jgi:redox-sensitive bicupin YhaK (pirin superfamily)